MKIIRLEEVDSTNDYAKKLREKGEDALIVALRQTGGRGTKGRSFSSEEGGVYLTRLKFYEDFPASRAFSVMADASVAVCKVLEDLGLRPQIKWPNDVYVRDKKICGILVENVFRGSFIRSSVVGIGLNVNNPLPPELLPIATSLSVESGREADREKAEKSLIGYLDKEYGIEEYRRRIGYLHRPVLLVYGEKKIPAVALGVDDRGRLLVRTGEREEYISAGEVSLRFEN